MPNYDVGCQECNHIVEDVLEPVNTTPEQRSRCEVCGGLMERRWTSKPSSVIGDEIDVYVKHALCNADGTPRRFRSRQELHRAAAEKGYVNYVEHLGTKGSDKSPHTVRWDATPSILTPEDELKHRLEWWIGEIKDNPTSAALMPDDIKELVRNLTDNTEDDTSNPRHGVNHV